MNVVIAIDAGTTGIRAVAVDREGSIVDSSYREFTQHFPEPGWVEHDPAEIWATTQAVLGELVPTIITGLDATIDAIGITDQRETVVAWNRRTGEVLHHAIVWQDRRTAEACDRLVADGHLPRVRELTGLVLDPYFSATKMRWLLDHGGPSGTGVAVAIKCFPNCGLRGAGNWRYTRQAYWARVLAQASPLSCEQAAL